MNKTWKESNGKITVSYEETLSMLQKKKEQLEKLKLDYENFITNIDSKLNEINSKISLL